MLKYYLQEMFEPTLLYGSSLAVLGVAASFYLGNISAAYGILAIVGSVLAQMSVNVISDYFDYQSGLDKELSHSKSGQLSGGSSLLARGMIKPRRALALGLAIFSLAAAIGIYLIYVRIQLLPIVLIAALSILLYARYVKKVPYMSEPLCSVNYILISLGCFIAVSGAAAFSYKLVFSFVPAGIMLGGNALFVNEVPDRKTDGRYGARHSAVMLGTSKRIGLYYLGSQSIAFLLLLSGIAAGAVPVLALACLLTLPTTFYVFSGLYREDSSNYGTYLGVHTLSAVVLVLILSVSYLLAV